MSKILMILTLLASFKPNHEDVNEPNRDDRLMVIARAQHDVASELTCEDGDRLECARRFPGSTDQLVRLLMVAGWWESRYSRRIHIGECRKGECDSGRARSVYQVHDNGTYPSEYWENSQGVDYESTRNATMAAALSFTAAWKACKRDHGDRGVWAAYGRGYCTASYPTLGGRIKWYWGLADRL